jgi:hypothetical protein
MSPPNGNRFDVGAWMVADQAAVRLAVCAGWQVLNHSAQGADAKPTLGERLALRLDLCLRLLHFRDGAAIARSALNLTFHLIG